MRSATPGTPRITGAAERVPFGGSVSGGIGTPDDAQTASGVLNVAYQHSMETDQQEFMDVDGDGLADIVRQSGSGPLELWQTHLDRTSNALSMTQQTLPTSWSYGYNQSNALTVGADASVLGGLITGGVAGTFTWTSASQLLTDANGDGLVDIVRQINDHGVPALGVYLNPFTPGRPPGSGFGLGALDADYNYTIGGYAAPAWNTPIPDDGRNFFAAADRATVPVVRWMAPRPGVVSISGVIAPDPSGGSTDGVHVSIYQATGFPTSSATVLLWEHDLFDSTWPSGAVCEPGPSNGCGGGLTVNLPDSGLPRLYFVVDGLSDTEGDRITWDPTITYQSVGACDTESQQQCPPVDLGTASATFKRSDDFRLADGRTNAFVASAAGDIQFDGTLTRVDPTLTGDVVITLYQQLPPTTPTPTACAGSYPDFRRCFDAAWATAPPSGGEPVWHAVTTVTQHDGDGPVSLPATHYTIARGERWRVQVTLPGFADPNAIQFNPTVSYIDVTRSEPDGPITRTVQCPYPGFAPDHCALVRATHSPLAPDAIDVPETAVKSMIMPAYLSGWQIWDYIIPNGPRMSGFYRGWSYGTWVGGADGLAFNEIDFGTAATSWDAVRQEAEAMLDPDIDPALRPRLPGMLNDSASPAGDSQRSVPAGAWRANDFDGYVSNSIFHPSHLAPFTVDRTTGTVTILSGVSDIRIPSPGLRSSHSWDFGAHGGFNVSFDGAGGAGGSVHVHTGESHSDVDFFDFNGDGLPDSVRPNEVLLQQTDPSYPYVPPPLQARFPTDPAPACDAPPSSSNHFAIGPCSGPQDDVRQVGTNGFTLGATVSLSGGDTGTETPKAQVAVPAPSARTKSSRQVGAGYGRGENHSTTGVDWIDVNGDGLRDRTRYDAANNRLIVQLNLGHDLGGMITIPLPGGACVPNPTMTTGVPSDTQLWPVYVPPGSPPPTDPCFGALPVTLSDQLSIFEDWSLSLGYSSGGYSIGGSAGVVDRYSMVNSVYVDMNGDGLPDRVVGRASDDALSVQFNMVETFTPTVNWYRGAWGASGEVPDGYLTNGQQNVLIASQAEAQSIGINASVAIYAYFLDVLIGLSAQFENEDGGGELSFADIDGDGLVDQTLHHSLDPKLRVRRNPIGAVNRLHVIHRPLGGTITLDYSRQGNLNSSIPLSPGDLSDVLGSSLSVVMPHNQWALTSVTMDDGHAFGSESGHHMVTTYDYHDSGYYDRLERENYGYAHITTTRPDGTIIDSAYYNQDFARHGLLAFMFEEGMPTPGHSDGTVYRETIHRIADQLVSVPGVPSAADPRTAHFAVPTETDVRVFGTEDPGVPMVETRERRTYEPRSTGSWEWVLTHVNDDGDTSVASDDVQYDIGYDPALQCLRATSIDATSVADPSVAPRHRRATYETNCAMESLTDLVTGGTDAVSGATFSSSPLTTWFKHDNYGNLVQAFDPTSYWVFYSYDTLMQQYRTQVSDAFGLASSATYEFERGLLTSTTDENGTTESYEYDPWGRIKSISLSGDGAVPTVGYTYGVMPGIMPDHPWATTAHMSLPTDSAPIVTSTFIDGFGRVIETKRDAVVDNGSGGTIYGMTASGRIEYDALGRVSLRGQPQFETTSATTFEEVPLTNATAQTYDPLSRPLVTTYPDGTSSRHEYHIVAAEAGFPAGGPAFLQRTDSYDPLNRVQNTFADAAGRTLRVREQDCTIPVADPIVPPSPSNCQPGTIHSIDTQYQYDGLGRLGRVIDAAGNHTDVTYDSLGRRIFIASPDTGTTEFRFDSMGNLGAKFTANRAGGDPIRYTYDRGRLMRVDYPSTGSGHLLPPVTYTYGNPGDASHAAGRLLQRTDESGVTTFVYGPLGEVTQTSVQLTSDGPTGLLDPMVTSFSYDRFGRMRSVTYPDSENVIYAYDAGGALSSVTSSAAPTPYVSEILYNEFGQRTSIHYGNGVVSHYSYDPVMRRMSEIDTTAPVAGGPATVNLQHTTYSYFANGNIAGVSNGNAFSGATGADGATAGQSFEYDLRDQLTYAAGSYAYTNTASSTILNTYTSNVAYDDIGNITRNQQTASLQMDSGPPIPDPNLTRDWTYSYDHTGDPTAPPHAPSHVGDRHYTWDRNGNQLGFTPTEGAVTRTIQWDDENRVSSIVDTSPGVPDQSTHFLNNANGERTHKISSVDSLVTVYPNQWVTARLGDPGMDGTRPIAVMTNHIYAGAQRLASRMTPAGETAQRFWYHGDHLSSSNYVTDDAATIDEHVEYFPYGETWIDEQMPRDGGSGEGSPERYLYTGKELDTETGLYYFGARYYDPQTAQWASGDPILENYLGGGPNGGVFSPINLGLYSYSWNSPIRLRDPNGTCPLCAAVGIGAGVGLVVYLAVTPSDQWSARGAIGSTVGGAAAGLTFGWGAPAATTIGGVMFVGATSSVVGGTVQQTIATGQPPTTAQQAQMAGWGGLIAGAGQLAANAAAGRALSAAPSPPTPTTPAPAAAVTSSAARSGLGDLTVGEVNQIQAAVDSAGRPIEVVGSAARGMRRPGSDIDYTAPAEAHPYFAGARLPGLDEHGILIGRADTHEGPSIRFAPHEPPALTPAASPSDHQ